MTRTLGHVALMTFLFAGCDVFDASFYLNADSGLSDTGLMDTGPVDTGLLDTGSEDTGPEDTAVDTAPDGGVFALADRCTGSAPLVVSSDTEIVVDTTLLSDRISDVASCAGTSAPGNDGFFAVEMNAGERWHFHVRALEAGGDPIVYVLGAGCDERTCQRGDAANNCNLVNEHFTYLAPTTGTFFIGIDDANARGGTYEVLPILPVCENGRLEHSESCDDGSASCNIDCQRVLADGASEDEPNDDPPGANILDFATGAIQGDVASQCDLASFRISVPAGGTIRASVLPRGEAVCNASAPALDLEIVSTDARMLHGSVSVAPGACPEILGTEPFASGLAAGDYVLRLVPTADVVELYDYDLSVDITSP